MNINLNTPQDTFTQQVDNTVINKINIRDNVAYMFIFTPKNIYKTKIRSYVYDFNNTFINAVDEMVATARSDSLKKVLPSAIKPDVRNSIDISSNMYDDKYTFVLVINRAGSPGSTIAVNTRIIASGYFGEEPIVPHTLNSSQPILNPNCSIHYTHVMDYAYNKEFLNRTSPIPFTITTDMDIVHTEGIDNPLVNQNAVVNDPHRVLNAFVTKLQEGTKFNSKDNNDQVFELPSQLSIFTKQDIDNKFKNPSVHVGAVAHSIKNAAGVSNERFEKISILNNENKDINTFKNNVVNELQNIDRTHGFARKNLDDQLPVTIGGLQQLYGNKLIVVPFRINKQSPWELKNPNVINPSTLYANFVAATIAEEATTCGLSTVLFKYKSFNTSVIDKFSTGVWEFSHVASMYQIPQEQLVKLVDDFKYILEKQLFPILKHSAGDFELVCFHDICQETLVDIKFVDFDAHVSGFHEVQNRFDFLYNPVISTKEVVAKNYSNLHNLINYIHSNNFAYNEITPEFNKNMFVANPVHDDVVNIHDDYIINEFEKTSNIPRKNSNINSINDRGKALRFEVKQNKLGKKL